MTMCWETCWYIWQWTQVEVHIWQRGLSCTAIQILPVNSRLWHSVIENRICTVSVVDVSSSVSASSASNTDVDPFYHDRGPTRGASLEALQYASASTVLCQTTCSYARLLRKPDDSTLFCSWNCSANWYKCRSLSCRPIHLCIFCFALQSRTVK